VLTPRPVLLYDGECGFCRDWIRQVQRWDKRQAIDYLPSQLRATIPWLPDLSDAALDRAVHLIFPDGRVYPGARSLPVLLPLLPGGTPLGLLMRLPGMLLVADRVYAWIAARRHRLGCGSGKCGI
jgi:predicted DCC family thiol-disulfide oxidoreductase YuxK